MNRSRFLLLGLLATVVACGKTSDWSAGAGGAAGTAGGASGDSGGGLANGGGCFEQGSVPVTQAQREQILANACEFGRVETPQTLEIVVALSDDSEAADPTNPDQTRWDTTRDALLTLIERDDNAGLPESVHVGLNFASVAAGPDQTGLDCGAALRVPIGRLGAASSVQRALLAQALLEFRPREAGLRDMFAKTVSELLAATPLVARPRVLLVTDGVSGLTDACGARDGDYEGLIEDVSGAASASVRTVVLGTPGSEPYRSYLSLLALNAGGALPCADPSSACYYELTAHPELGAELRAELFGHFDVTPGCLDLPPPGDIEPGIDAAKTNVLYTLAGKTSLIAPSCSEQCTLGWWLKSDLSLHLCSETCASIHELTSVLEIVHGCAN